MVDINVDRDLANKPFLLSRFGKVVFLSTVMATLFFFLSLADHTPPFLGTGPDEKSLPPGIYLSPVDSPNFATGLSVLVFIFITTLLVGYLVIYLNESRKNDNSISLSIPLLAALVYIACLTVGILFWPDIGIEGRRIINQPKAVLAGFISQIIVIASVTYTYSHPIFPKKFPDSIGKDWEIYLQNQWRFAQVLLTVVLSIFIGTAIPMTASNGTFGISGTISLIGFLIPGPAAIILFVAIRVHTMEKMIREYGPSNLNKNTSGNLGDSID